MASKLSIACVFYNNSDAEIEGFLESLGSAISELKQQDQSLLIDCLLVNNGRPANKLESGHANTVLGVESQLIEGQGNIGYGRAHNLALENTNSDFHLILNPDIELESKSLLLGLNYLYSNSDTVLLSPQVVNAHGDMEYLCKRYPAALTLFIRAFLPEAIRNLFRTRLDRYCYREETDRGISFTPELASGCLMLCPTEALKRVRGFDPAYFLYFEDFDLSLRIAKIGDIAYLPTMKIVHRGGYAARKGIRHIALFMKSAWRFYSSHGWRLIRQ